MDRRMEKKRQGRAGQWRAPARWQGAREGGDPRFSCLAWGTSSFGHLLTNMSSSSKSCVLLAAEGANAGKLQSLGGSERRSLCTTGNPRHRGLHLDLERSKEPAESREPVHYLEHRPGAKLRWMVRVGVFLAQPLGRAAVWQAHPGSWRCGNSHSHASQAPFWSGRTRRRRRGSLNPDQLVLLELIANRHGAVIRLNRPVHPATKKNRVRPCAVGKWRSGHGAKHEKAGVGNHLHFGEQPPGPMQGDPGVAQEDQAQGKNKISDQRKVRHSAAFRTLRHIERNSDAVTAPSVPASTSRAKSTLGFRSPARARESVLGDRPMRTANAERRSLFWSRKD